MNKHDRCKLIDTENKLIIAIWGVGEMGEDDEGMRKYILAVTK